MVKQTPEKPPLQTPADFDDGAVKFYHELVAEIRALNQGHCTPSDLRIAESCARASMAERNLRIMADRALIIGNGKEYRAYNSSANAAASSLRIGLSNLGLCDRARSQKSRETVARSGLIAGDAPNKARDGWGDLVQ